MRPIPVFAIFVPGLFLIPGLVAQSAAPAPAPILAAPDAPPNASASTPSVRPRAVSPEMAAKLSLNAPKFVAPKTGTADPPLPAPDLRQSDPPKNGIVRLPNYVVREPKVPVFPERELLTPKGKLDLAYKRRPGLRFGSLPFFSNDGIARSLLEADYERERLAEMKELSGLLGTGDPGPAKGK